MRFVRCGNAEKVDFFSVLCYDGVVPDRVFVKLSSPQPTKLCLLSGGVGMRMRRKSDARSWAYH